MKRFKTFAGTVALAAVAFGVPAQAVVFNLTDTSGNAGKGTQARLGFDIATAYWSSVLTDNITINLNIGFSSLASGILGSTGSTRSLLSMNQYYAAAAADITSTLDARAVANLPTLSANSALGTGYGAVTALGNALNANSNGYLDTATRLDNDGSINNATLAVTKASAKALGLTSDVNGTAINYGSADASITFSSNYNFDFNPTDGITAGAYDFIGIAIHEIGHALGFVSGVDSYDAYTSPGRTAVVTAQPNALENYVVNSQLDLFRYSATSAAQGALDWTTQNDVYFSLDKGATQLFGNSLFSTGSYNGDGRQASHWKDNKGLGILDPTAAGGELLAVTGLDIAAFDVIGYNTAFDAALDPTYRFTTAQAYSAFAPAALASVPEPSSWAFMIAGIGAVGGVMRYRRRRTAVRYAVAR